MKWPVSVYTVPVCVQEPKDVTTYILFESEQQMTYDYDIDDDCGYFRL